MFSAASSPNFARPVALHVLAKAGAGEPPVFTHGETSRERVTRLADDRLEAER